ncbi:MAG: Sir2 silent information regulator family NAD-dependent deacetylase, partial [Pyramidobacter sp.]|nr:Sir2 silent information regulator family NAD-dependent deacetylase [Pyramidobacter sp.]
CEALFVGAGAGLSAAAGLDGSGGRFEKYFTDFERRFGIRDMAEGCSYSFDTLEEHWAYWSRHIYVSRFMNAPKNVYRDLLRLARGKDYFVVATGAGHGFERARFDKSRLFYPQGDLGLFQCSVPCHAATYDSRETVTRMVTSQGFMIGESGALVPPPDGRTKARVPSSLIPRCPKCGRPMTVNLRRDAAFVQDENWRAAAARWDAFCKAHETGRAVYLELGAEPKTPDSVSSQFTQRAKNNPDALIIRLSNERQPIPEELAARTVQLAGDIAATLKELLEAQK